MPARWGSAGEGISDLGICWDLRNECPSAQQCQVLRSFDSAHQQKLAEFKVSRACEDSGVDSSAHELLSFLQGIVSESAVGELKVKLRIVLLSADGNSGGKAVFPKN